MRGLGVYRAYRVYRERLRPVVVNNPALSLTASAPAEELREAVTTDPGSVLGFNGLGFRVEG